MTIIYKLLKFIIFKNTMECNTIEEFNFFTELHPYTEYNRIQSERHDEESIVQSGT
ncbi:hypothetical protein RO3G_12449 [Rhizopus delemar RA 99-880]|uniref:Uncharacterized protein n=1 Tax=Rhizopus delemar (strain RA 99-880 / ATCC MYA-4621 / FGSC 9543 / NRRL 43880) TaxID=246409 RepID=I1CH08_RHIO9|nr:hypothetical protein RO3G_12449 [Rhizopus delemar RA 99-880]|eukprot:EIE87738.1 hypothetical protein RO3G_12449 [Rhizopus delemar RA 99-880]